MRLTKLTNEEKNLLEFIKNNPKTTKNEYERCSGILLNQEKSAKEIGEIFGKTQRTVYNWLNLWEKNKQTTKNHNKGRREFIRDEEEKIFIEENIKNYSTTILVKIFNEKFNKTISQKTLVKFIKKNLVTKKSKNVSKKQS